jgi:hypothetical protein
MTTRRDMPRHEVKTFSELGSQNIYQFPTQCPTHPGNDRNQCFKSFAKCNCHFETVPGGRWGDTHILLKEDEVIKGMEVWTVNEWSPYKADKSRTVIKHGAMVEEL